MSSLLDTTTGDVLHRRVQQDNIDDECELALCKLRRLVPHVDEHEVGRLVRPCVLVPIVYLQSLNTLQILQHVIDYIRQLRNTLDDDVRNNNAPTAQHQCSSDNTHRLFDTKFTVNTSSAM
jgi:hypothetical protein